MQDIKYKPLTKKYQKQHARKTLMARNTGKKKAQIKNLSPVKTCRTRLLQRTYCRHGTKWMCWIKTIGVVKKRKPYRSHTYQTSLLGYHIVVEDFIHALIERP